MAAKRPVVITKVGDIPFYLKDGDNALLAEPNNPNSLCQKFEFVFNNRILGEEIGEKGYFWGMENLDYRANTLKLLEFFNMQ